MQYLPGISSPWLTYDEFVPHIMTAENYRQCKVRGNLRASCVGGNGRVILIEFDSLRKADKQAVIDKYGDPRAYIAMQPLKNLKKVDLEARVYYSSKYILPSGEYLPVDYQIKYALQCEWLAVISKVLTDKQTLKEELGVNVLQFWDNISLLINTDTEKHELPTSVDRLRRRYKLYKDKGYAGIVEAWRFCNDYARKVTPKIEGLILALYCRQHRPYMNEVCRDYRRFIKGEIDVVDMVTGEMYDPKEFYIPAAKSKSKTSKREMVPYELGESTVDYYLKSAANKPVVDSKRMSKLEHTNTHRPYMLREAPMYSMSKLTMDDTSSPFKMHNGDRPATYKVFDVASGALLVTAMHENKRPDAALIRRMIADMIGMVAQNGWKMPYEIEMERAITTSMMGDGVEKDVLSAGAVFPYVRLCAPKNPQEKRAEGFIKQLKYSFHKHREGFQFRPFARTTAHKENEDVKEVRFTFEEIRGFEMADMMAWNNTPADQEKYPGLTRWQALEQCQNPNLPVIDLSIVMPYVGYKTKTSVRRMQVQVMGNFYRSPNTDILNDLIDTDVIAYWLPDEHGNVPEVYLYQDGAFISKALKAERFQEARIEQTTDDLRIMGQQKSFVNKFDTKVAARLADMGEVGIVERGMVNVERQAVAPMQVVALEIDEPVAAKQDSRSVLTRALNDL